MAQLDDLKVIVIQSNKEATNKSLQELITEKFQFSPNTEQTRREVMFFIEKYFMENMPTNCDRNHYSRLIKHHKFSYYKNLVSQAQLSIKEQKELIDQFLENQEE